MKRFLILLILSFFSLQSYAGSCPDGSDPVRSISADGTYFVYNCAGSSNNNTSSSTNSSSSATTSSSKSTSIGIDRFGGISEIPEDANPNFETLQYYLYRYLYSFNKYPFCSPNDKQLHCEDIPPKYTHSIESSNNPYQFQSDLREDNYVKKQLQDTALLSYLLYEDGKIVIDEKTPEDRFGRMFRDSSKFHSQSVAKTLISYVTGHAICKGYIDSVDSRLNDWPVLENTLYHNQKLIDVLNMASGTQEYFDGSNRFTNSNRTVTSPTVEDIMNRELKGSKKSHATYNYVNLNPNLVGSYLIYKLGDDNFQALLDDVFKKKARIEGDVFFIKNERAKKNDISIMSNFFASRYDYLRVAKAMLDDWENDNCVGQYLKTIHERRIPKNGAQGTKGRVGLPLSYGGFFHTGYKGMENRPVMGMDGYGGQTILIDFERGRIISTQAIHDNMKFPQPGGIDFKKMSYERIKNGKPSSKSKPPPEPVVDSQQIIKERNAAIEAEKKAKQYWDDYYDCTETTSGKSNIEACINNVVKKREKTIDPNDIDLYGDAFKMSGGTVSIPESANPNNETLRYFLYKYLYYAPQCCESFHKVEASNPYNFQFDLREDRYIKQQMQTTPLLSYLLYEDDKIVIDEITPKDRFGDMFTDSSVYHSRSMGKSITSYLAGHAICEGEIKSVDSRLDDWPILQNTLYHNQKLINLLNMSAGDSAYIKNDNFINSKGLNTFNDSSLQMMMKNEFRGSKKSFAQYSYNDVNPNIVLSYLWYKYGEDDFKRLLDDVFAKKIRIGDEIFFNKTGIANKDEKSLMHTFYTTRYDYLRIAKAMLDDWENDTCVGKYLKTIHERRIPKNGAQGSTGRVGMPGSYGGFFHTGYKGMENRPVMSMDGYGGQTITIDFERGRIVVTQAIHDSMKYPKPGSFDWKKIVYETIRNGKPASTSIVKKPAEPAINPEQIILNNKARQESQKKAKEYWDNYYAKLFWGTSAKGASTDDSPSFSEDFENADQRKIRVVDEQNNWFIKQDNDGNAMYCNKASNNWTDFMLGSANWTNYSISYKVKLSSKKSGTLETHIRKGRNNGPQYRAINKIPGRAAIEFAHPTKKINQGIASGERAAIGDKWSDIKLIALGNSIKYLVNGKVVASTNDDRAKEGAVMIAASSNLEVCIDNIIIKKEIVTEENETPVVKEIKEDKFSSEKTELFKNIKSSDVLDGYYSFTLVKSPMTELGSGSLEINNGIVTITKDSRGMVKPSYDSFEGRIDQNGDIKALFYLSPCSGCEDKLVEFNGNLNKKNLRGKYNDIQINFYLTAKKGDVIKVETKTVETKKVITSDSDPTVSKIIEVTHGDKLIVDIAEPHELAGSNIKVSLKDIDTPDATRSCPKQMELGEKVRDFVEQKLENASSVKLTNYRKTNTKIIAQVIVDGVDLGEELVSKGYASEEYGYWKPYFCSALSATNQADQYVDTDQKKAIFWFERSIVLDPDGSKNQESHFLLSKMYSSFGNTDKSLENLKKSASLEWIPAMEQLGSNYLNGSGVKKDSNQGKKWLKKAFDKGSQRAEDVYCGSLPKAKQKTCKF